MWRTSTCGPAEVAQGIRGGAGAVDPSSASSSSCRGTRTRRCGQWTARSLRSARGAVQIAESDGRRVAVYNLENDHGAPDLRAREGLHRRRRVVHLRLGQLQPPLLDLRQRTDLRGPRPDSRGRGVRDRGHPPARAGAAAGGVVGASRPAAPQPGAPRPADGLRPVVSEPPRTWRPGTPVAAPASGHPDRSARTSHNQCPGSKRSGRNRSIG